jgi:hypothetical protein
MVAFLLGHEFLDRREHDAARTAPQLFAQIRAALGLLRVAAQQITAAHKGREELAVKVVAVGDDEFSIAGCRISRPA